MIFGKTIASAALGAAILALSAGAALATPAHATGSVNVRTGPGIGYHRVDTLHPGERVDVRGCERGWCFVDHYGLDGWVSDRYLRLDGGYWPAPRPNVGIQFGFSFGSPGYNYWPRLNPLPRPNPWPYPPRLFSPW